MRSFKRLFAGALCAALLCSLLTVPSSAVSGTVIGSNSDPLSNAKVVCQVLEAGVWRDWASESWKLGHEDYLDIDPSTFKVGAEDYGQNPFMYTDTDGRCGWLLPPGTYRFKVMADGYLEFTSNAFTVGTQAGNVDNSHNLGNLVLSTPTPPPTATPTATPSTEPSVSPSVSPGVSPSISPGAEPSISPSAEPSVSPSAEPSASPSAEPSVSPSAEPSVSPSAEPSVSPSAEPSVSPSAEPSAAPSSNPSSSPNSSGFIFSSRTNTSDLVKLNLSVGVVPRGSLLTLTATDKASNNVVFYYTTNGSNPTKNSAKYDGPIVIDKDMTVKVAAFRGTTRGSVESYRFTVTDPRPGSFAPTASATRYLVGYRDGTFRPNQPATRYEVAEALNHLLVLGDGSTSTVSLSDLVPNHAVSVSRLMEVGLINGMEDGTFRGDSSLTRAQICKILCLVLGLKSDVQYSQSFSDVSGHWGIGYIGALAKAGYLKGYEDGTFRPDQPVTRAELAVLLNRAAGRNHVAGEAVEYFDVSSDFWGYDDIQSASLSIQAAGKK